MKKRLIGIVFAIASTATVHAQEYPRRPITMIVPFPAGSAFDLIARVLAEGMQASLG